MIEVAQMLDVAIDARRKAEAWIAELGQTRLNVDRQDGRLFGPARIAVENARLELGIQFDWRASKPCPTALKRALLDVMCEPEMFRYLTGLAVKRLRKVEFDGYQAAEAAAQMLLEDCARARRSDQLNRQAEGQS